LFHADGRTERDRQRALTKLIVAFAMLRIYLEKLLFFSTMIIDFMKEGIEQVLEVSCMVLISVANINWKCRTYKNNFLHTMDSVLNNIVNWNKMNVIDNMCVFSHVCKFRKLPLASSCLSVCPSIWNTSVSTGRIFMKFAITVFFDNLSRKFVSYSNPTGITGTLFEDQYTFLIISHSVLLRWRNILDQSCRENQNTFYVQQLFQ
jgi:hypothetical protein